MSAEDVLVAGHPEAGAYLFQCPGCENLHVVYTVAGEGHPTWSFNGDLKRPTFSPSLLYWIDANPERGYPAYRCHSFVREGQIQFLDDCTHALRGQTVPLPPSRWAREEGDDA